MPQLMVRLKQHCPTDPTLLRPINRYLKAGVPQGGPLSPVLSNVVLDELDRELERRGLRCYLWKQWGRACYRELRRGGVGVREAWNTCKTAHGPWRISKTPALTLALPRRTFQRMGLPELAG